MTLPLAAVLGWLFTGGLLALSRRRNWGKAIRAKGPEGHKVKEGTPTLGGVAFLAAAVGCWALIGPHSLESAVVVALVLASGLLGLLDDLLALRRGGGETTGLLARYRLPIQGVLGLAFAFFAVRQGLGPIGISTLDTPLLTLIVVGTINGFNFTDGLDGLAAGVAAIVLLAFLAAPFVAPLLGALLGFLWFNAFPARIFMGGVGSEALGAAVAGIAILEGMVWYLPLVALIPVLEVLSVIVQVSYFRITGGRRLLRMSPLHHHFELSGWSEQRVVTRFWIATALAVAAAAWLKGTAS